jgi:hypothetical protein
MILRSSGQASLGFRDFFGTGLWLRQLSRVPLDGRG